VLASIVAPAAANAQTLPSASVQVTPKRAGTEERPKGVKLSVGFTFPPPADGQDSPTLVGGRLLLPRGFVFNGARYPRCRLKVMRHDESVENCPKRSIMGQARGVAYVEPPFGSRPTFTVVNGGARRIWLFTTIYNPALVQRPVALNVKPLRGRKWAYELSFEMPEVLQIVAGVPIEVPPTMGFSFGLKPYAREFMAIDRGCPKRGFRRYAGSLSLQRFENRTVTTTDYRGRIACR
jgi:hypothetical protein